MSRALDHRQRHEEQHAAAVPAAAAVARLAAAVAPPAALLQAQRPRLASSLSSANVLELQRSAGNNAVARLMGAGRAPAPVPSRCACGGITLAGGECEGCRRRREAVEHGEERVLARQATVTPPVPGPGLGGPGGGNRCLELLGEILSFVHGGLTHLLDGQTISGTAIKRGLIERYNDMLNDPADLYNRHRYKSNPGPGGLGSWEGHQDQFEMQQRGLRNRLNDWIRNTCDDPQSGLPVGARPAYDEALEWATRPTPQQPSPKPVATPRMPRDISWSDVLDVLITIGLTVALVALVIAALADPEPVTKVGLAVGSAALALLILTRLGLLQEPDPAAVASQQNYPEQDEAVA